MNVKRINIDVEVIKSSKMYELNCVEASDYEHPLPKTVPKPNKWQSLKNDFKNKIIRRKNFRKI